MKEFVTFAIALIIICLVLFCLYSCVIDKMLGSQKRIDSSEIHGLEDELRQKADEDSREQKFSAKEIREKEKRLLEERKMKLEDHMRRH